MKKIIIIVILVLSVGLIGTGLFFTFTDKENKNKNSDKIYSNEGIVDVDKELEKEEVHTENVHIYRTIEDAVEFLKSSYETDSVEVSYNDGTFAKIKVFPDTSEQVTYIYQIKGGDLLIER